MEINVTDTLRDTIKKYRKEVGLRGDTLARALKKNTSYISQLETGKIKTIDTSLLTQIFEEIFKDEKTTDKNKKIEDILKQLNFSLSDKELKRQSWMRVMDLQERLIPIPDSIISYIKDKLEKLNLTSEELINIVNQNQDLYDSNYSEDELDKMEDNKVYVTRTNNAESTRIKFNLDSTFLSDILDKKIVRCNFITMQGIIYNILLKEGIDKNIAYDNAQDILFEHKFYTMLKKQHLEKNSDNLAPYDVQFRKNLNTLADLLNTINNHQPDFLNHILEPFIKNIEKEPSLTLSIIKRDLTSLHKMSKENKANFISDFTELISKYETNSVEDQKKIETF